MLKQKKTYKALNSRLVDICKVYKYEYLYHFPDSFTLKVFNETCCKSQDGYLEIFFIYTVGGGKFMVMVTMQIKMLTIN